MTRNYFRGSVGVLIVYDLTSPDSFEKVRTWLAEVRQHARSEATYMVFGNKLDMARDEG